ncbi:MAG: SDR family oxidoreductase [Rectinemataceae bacterium]
MAMKVLFIGGTGNLSYECSLRALSEGVELYHLNRGRSRDRTPAAVVSLNADMSDEASLRSALDGLKFDAVVQFIAYRPEQVEADLRLLRDRTAQYVFISSASAYRKPPVSHVITEATPLDNPYWKYARDKIACERLLEAERGASGFPYTIVRPSHTYGLGWVPTPFGSSDFTIARRILDGKDVIVHGDGQSLWTITHARDFAVGLVGLLGNPAAIGEAVQIMGDEVLTWEAIYRCVGAALGVEPKIVHIPSDFIAKVEPELAGPFLGDKTWSAIFDCSKLKRLVPAFRTTIPFHRGIRESVAWLLADPARQTLDPETDATVEKILAAFKRL